MLVMAISTLWNPPKMLIIAISFLGFLLGCAARQKYILNPTPLHGPKVCGKSFDEVCTLLPTSLHLDGAEVTRNSEFYFYNFSSLTVQKDAQHPLDSVFLCAAVPYCIMRVPGMKKKVMKLFADFTQWNLQVMKTKTLPDRGFYDEPFDKGRGC